jgi:hypothetical protein
MLTPLELLEPSLPQPEPAAQNQCVLINMNAIELRAGRALEQCLEFKLEP